MEESVFLYLASFYIDDIVFWDINFSPNQKPFLNSAYKFKLLECYRNELIGIKAAKDITNAIKITIKILTYDCKEDGFEIFESTEGYSYEIPLYIMENIFDFWYQCYLCNSEWEKYIGILRFRSKIKDANYFLETAFIGETYKFVVNLIII